MSDGFWLFEGLEDDPYGLLPLNNLSGKVSATTTKHVDRLGSYQWYLYDNEPTILIPGMPKESFFFPGGRLPQDRGVVIYDVNHFKVPLGSLDPIILATRHLSQKRKKPINFDEFDFITDAVNLQKLFAFAQEAGDGLFRIDCERVGKTVLLTRVEASDLMEVGHLTYDQALKQKMTKTRSKHTSGPFFQLVAYQFGQFRILVRYEVDAGNYAAGKVGEFEEVEKLPERQKFAENQNINFVDFGDISKAVPLQLITTYPAGGGFPFFTWAQMFFTAAEQEVVGFFKDNGDFGKPSFYALTDISRLMKPLPYAVLSKVHDALAKVRLFLVKNDPEFRCGLIWKGKPHLEIFAKKPEAQSAVSPGIKEYLATVCKDPVSDESVAQTSTLI